MTTLKGGGAVRAVDRVTQLQAQAASLLLYQSVLAGTVGAAFQRLLEALGQMAQQDAVMDTTQSPAVVTCLQAYGHWFHALAVTQRSWRSYLISQLAAAENPLTDWVQQQPEAPLPKAWMAAARQDLAHLQALAQGGEALPHWIQALAGQHTELTLDEAAIVPAHIASTSPLALFAEAPSWADQLPVLVDYYRRRGTGIFGEYMALRWQGAHLQGIGVPDPIRLADLVGYEGQREALLANTEALLAGQRALNVLLYGSRGTGKSALIKALLWEYCDRGLRLIEVAKADLPELPQIVDQVRDRPQKFVLFVDDLSFEADEEHYKALKVVLEGNLTARPQNVVVYATSNRRHLIREFFADRPSPSHADEVHAWDTVQEKLALSDRFGLTLTFEPPDQPTYLRIVHHLAAQAQLSLPSGDLEFQALQWATRQNGRSGRTARQCIDYLLAQQARQRSSP